MMTATASAKSGTIKMTSAAKGFGFVTDTETGKDFFFHASSVRNAEGRKEYGLFDQLQAGDPVTYELDPVPATDAAGQARGPRCLYVWTED